MNVILRNHCPETVCSLVSHFSMRIDDLDIIPRSKVQMRKQGVRTVEKNLRIALYKLSLHPDELRYVFYELDRADFGEML